MNKEDNISDEQGVKELFPVDSQLNEPLTLNPVLPGGQQQSNMEAHHHVHHSPAAGGRKKFGHYFYEFLMLFLAVFCGFLAENFREHYIEDLRAEKLAKNLFKEVLADSVLVQQRIAVRETKENQTKYFIAYVKDSSLTNLNDRFMPAFSWTFIQTQRIFFEPNDGILNQLRNSGELRYFKNRELQSALGNLSVMIANIRDRNEREYTFIADQMRPFSLTFYDFNWYEALVSNGNMALSDALNKKIVVPFEGKIQNPGKFDRLEAAHIASYSLLMLRGTRRIQYQGYVEANHQVLELLRKEFHL